MRELDNELKTGKISRLHLLFGDEFYQVREYKKRLTSALSAEEDDFNRIFFTGKEADEASIADFGNLAPFMSDKRLIVIDDGGFFASSGENKELKSVIENLPETTYVIFAERQVNKTVSMYKWFQKLIKNKTGLISEFKKIDGKELELWISAYIAKANKRITRGALRLLTERLGNDMTLLKSEMDKLIAYVGDEEGIREADVDAICGGVIVSKIFDMVNAVSRGDSDTALSLYRDLIHNREEPLVILSLLGRQFMSMYRAKTTLGLSGTKEEQAKKLGMSSRAAWKVGEVRSLAEKFSTEKLEEILEHRAQTDEQIKTTDIDRQVAVEIFLISSLTK